MADYTDEQLIAMAMANLGEYIHIHGTPDYILLDQLDPRNEDDYAKQLRNSDDYDDWYVGMEPIPGDHTWKSIAIDVQAEEIN
jgi:hypothetical protein